MTNRPPWQEAVLKHFEPQTLRAVPLTVVEDRDKVVGSEQIATELRRRSADLISYGDPVAFRHIAESRYRGSPDAQHLVVRADDLVSLPWDILQAAERQGRRISISLSSLFPSLHAEVLPYLDRTHLDVLSEALSLYSPRLGLNGTIDFILQHVFHVVPSTISDDASLLAALIELHYTEEVLPEPIVQRLVALLISRRDWRTWPLQDLLTSSTALWSFLQARWPGHLLAVTGNDVEPEPDVAEPRTLPFTDPRVRVRMDNLFVEGFLTPSDVVSWADAKAVGVAFGVVSEDRSPYDVLVDLTQRVGEVVPTAASDHNDWRRFARTWGEWTAARIRVHNLEKTELAETVAGLQSQVHSTFATWMFERYAGLISLPHFPTPPMLHHIPDYLSHGRIDGQTVNRKVALLVLDGMGFAQWHEVRPFVESLDASLEEHAVFAWVPTLTVVSRQAIFAGTPPYAYAQSIHTTQKEPRHWRRYWMDKGLRETSIRYVHAQKLGSGDAIVQDFVDEIEHPATRVLGGVIGTIDQLAHAAKTTASGFHAALTDWLEQGVLTRVLEALLDADYDIYITSDHGNLEVRGSGRPNLGSIPDEQGERAGVFPTEEMRTASMASMPQGIKWPPHGLPPEYFPVLAPWDGAFIPDKFQLVSHGGIALDETVVPFISLRTPS